MEKRLIFSGAITAASTKVGAGGAGGDSINSADAITWAATAPFSTNTVLGIVRNGILWYIIANGINPTNVFQSTDGTIFSGIYSILDSIILLRTSGVYYMVTSGPTAGTYYKTSDWVTVNTFVIASFVGSISGLHYSSLLTWAAKGNAGEVATSADGETWTPVVTVGGPSAGPAFWYFSLVGLWLSGGAAGASGIQSSPDLAAWTNRQNTVAEIINAIADNGVAAVAVGTNGTIYRSTNGTVWAAQVSGTVQTLNDCRWVAALNLFVAVGNAGTVLTSPTGVVWTAQVSGTVSDLYAVGSAT